MNESLEFKKRMAKSFSKKADAYDRKAGLQKEVASSLRDCLKDRLVPGLEVLDVGCGTGLLSLPLVSLGLRVHAIDMAPGMITMIRRKTTRGEDIHPVVGDAEFLPYAGDTFDLVMSSLTYHWIWNLPAAFREALRVLRKGGYFSIAVSGRDTLSELKDVYAEVTGNDLGLAPLVTFPGSEEIRDSMVRSGFSNVGVESRRMVRNYPDFWDLLRSMKAIGAANPYRGRIKSLGTKAVLESIRRRYHEKYSDRDGVRATYENIFCSGGKPGKPNGPGTSS